MKDQANSNFQILYLPNSDCGQNTAIIFEYCDFIIFQERFF